jgi:hypothetical protein
MPAHPRRESGSATIYQRQSRADYSIRHLCVKRSFCSVPGRTQPDAAVPLGRCAYTAGRLDREPREKPAKDARSFRVRRERHISRRAFDNLLSLRYSVSSSLTILGTFRMVRCAISSARPA